MKMMHADADKPGRKEGDVDPLITVGATVRRKRGKQNTGVIERIYTVRTMRDREWGYRACQPYKVATIKWQKAVRHFGSDGSWTSTVRLDSLVLVKAREGA